MDQMEMMTMMMQLDKLPQYCGHNNQDIYEFPEMDQFSGGSSSSVESTPPNFHSSFMGSPVQEPMTQFLAPIFPTPQLKSSSELLQKANVNSVEATREMIFHIAAMQPIQIDPESVKPPQRRNVKISKDPQSVAARHRRERISEKIRILQRLVPGGTKMDTASMLDEAVHYVKFLKKQVQSLERAGPNRPMGVGYPATMATAVNMNYYSPLARANCQPAQMVGSMQMLR